jgi:hypothetical protein
MGQASASAGGTSGAATSSTQGTRPTPMDGLRAIRWVSSRLAQRVGRRFRLRTLDGEPGRQHRYQGVDELISEHAESLFPGMSKGAGSHVLGEEDVVVAIGKHFHRPWTVFADGLPVWPEPIAGVLPVQHQQALCDSSHPDHCQQSDRIDRLLSGRKRGPIVEYRRKIKRHRRYRLPDGRPPLGLGARPELEPGIEGCPVVVIPLMRDLFPGRLGPLGNLTQGLSRKPAILGQAIVGWADRAEFAALV